MAIKKNPYRGLEPFYYDSGDPDVKLDDHVLILNSSHLGEEEISKISEAIGRDCSGRDEDGSIKVKLKGSYRGIGSLFGSYESGEKVKKDLEKIIGNLAKDFEKELEAEYAVKRPKKDTKEEPVAADAFFEPETPRKEPVKKDNNKPLPSVKAAEGVLPEGFVPPDDDGHDAPANVPFKGEEEKITTVLTDSTITSGLITVTRPKFSKKITGDDEKPKVPPRDLGKEKVDEPQPAKKSVTSTADDDLIPFVVDVAPNPSKKVVPPEKNKTAGSPVKKNVAGGAALIGADDPTLVPGDDKTARKPTVKTSSSTVIPATSVPDQKKNAAAYESSKGDLNADIFGTEVIVDHKSNAAKNPPVVNNAAPGAGFSNAATQKFKPLQVHYKATYPKEPGRSPEEFVGSENTLKMLNERYKLGIKSPFPPAVREINGSIETFAKQPAGTFRFKVLNYGDEKRKISLEVNLDKKGPDFTDKQLTDALEGIGQHYKGVKFKKEGNTLKAEFDNPTVGFSVFANTGMRREQLIAKENARTSPAPKGHVPG